MWRLVTNEKKKKQAKNLQNSFSDAWYRLSEVVVERGSNAIDIQFGGD